MKITEIPDNCPYCGTKVILEDKEHLYPWWNGFQYFSCETKFRESDVCSGWKCFCGREKSFMTVNWETGKDVSGICFDFRLNETRILFHREIDDDIIIPFVDDTLDFSDITIDYMNRLLKLKAFL